MKIDILAIGAHPDDVELGCSGTIAKEIANNKKVGILDLTKGELGTRGSAEIREKEANHAAKILNVAFRENLNFKDGFFKNDEEHQEINSKNEIVIALFSFTIKPFKTEKRDARKADINPNTIPFKY